MKQKKLRQDYINKIKIQKKLKSIMHFDHFDIEI